MNKVYSIFVFRSWWVETVLSLYRLILLLAGNAHTPNLKLTQHWLSREMFVFSEKHNNPINPFQFILLLMHFRFCASFDGNRMKENWYTTQRLNLFSENPISIRAAVLCLLFYILSDIDCAAKPLFHRNHWNTHTWLWPTYFNAWSSLHSKIYHECDIRSGCAHIGCQNESVDYRSGAHRQ